MEIKFNNLSKQWDEIREQIAPRLDELFKKKRQIKVPPMRKYLEC